MKLLFLLAAAVPSLALAQPQDIAYEIVEGLTTEIGPRLAGTEAEERAREWSVKKLKSLGFSNVRIEPFDMPVWVRGTETAAITGRFAQQLAVTALGDSGPTPVGGLNAEIVRFDGIAALEAAAPGSLAGKIAYITHRMTATQDGSQYAHFGAIRRTGADVAASKGAVALLIRSIGSDRSRSPHTGNQGREPGKITIPAAALSIVDSEQLDRVLALGQPVSVKLVLTPRTLGTRQSGNVVAEVTGRDPKAGIVLIGGHLDSWDLGTGAIDDAAGVAITAAAAKRILDAPGRQRRTIRLVWFGAEEVGLIGGRAYRDRHRGEPHAVAAESDFGADRIWRLDVNFPPEAKPVADRLALALAPLGIAPGKIAAQGGPDIGPLVATGVSAIDLQQDGTRYFDLHHTDEDTLDKIDRAQLAQNVDAWAAMLEIVTDASENLIKSTPAK